MKKKSPSRPPKKSPAKKPSKSPAATTALAKRPEATDDLIKVEADKKLGPAAALANHAKAMEVDDAHLPAANALLGTLKQTREGLEEQRTFFTKPLRDHVKRIEELFRPTIKRLEEADEGLRAKVVTFIDAKRIAAEKEAALLTAKAHEAAAKGQDTKAANLAVKAVETVEAATARVMQSDTGSTSTRQVDDFEIEDMGKVPKEYLTLDEKAVRAAMRSGVSTIPGLRIFKRTTLAVSATGGAPASA